MSFLTPTIEMEESKYIPKKELLHTTLKRNGSVVPSLKCRVCTKEFLWDMKCERVGVLRYMHIPKLQCMSPPPIIVLNKMLREAITMCLGDKKVFAAPAVWKTLVERLDAK